MGLWAIIHGWRGFVSFVGKQRIGRRFEHLMSERLK